MTDVSLSNEPSPREPSPRDSTTRALADWDSPRQVVDSAEAALARYHAFSPWAIGALALGVLSPLAMFAPLLWILPLAGVWVSAVALWQINASEGAWTGRRMAIFGLAASALFAVAGPVDRFATRVYLERAARPVAEFWLNALKQGRAEQALQLTAHPGLRRPLDEKLPDYYHNDLEAHESLERFVGEREIRLLLSLGDRLTFRHYLTTSIDRNERGDFVNLIYAATYDDGGRQTFFISLTVERLVLDGVERSRVTSYRGGVHPAL